MKRTHFLPVALLALILAACGGEPTATSSPTSTSTPTVEPTEEPTPSPTEAAETDAPDDGGDGDGGFTGSLIDVLPEELNGAPRMEVEGMEQFILPMLQQQNIEVEEADFAFASYGDEQDAVVVTALRMEGVSQSQLELLARMMSAGQTDAGGDVEAETVTVGGKEVLRVTPTDGQGQVLIYIVDDAFFTIISESADLAEELLSQLP